MNYTVQELALRYAEALIAYHEISYHCEGSAFPEDIQLLEQRHEAMQEARRWLSGACRRAAEMNYIA